jgi:two-component system OmpR family response regulator
VNSYPMNNTYQFQSSLKALIIDDESDICYLLGNILRQRNYHTTYAGSLTEAGKLLESHNDFAIVFLDNHLPDGFGISFIDRVKEKNPLAQLVMITAHDAVSDKEKAVRNGADFFIGKPFTREIIFKTLDRFTA